MVLTPAMALIQDDWVAQKIERKQKHAFTQAPGDQLLLRRDAGSAGDAARGRAPDGRSLHAAARLQHRDRPVLLQGLAAARAPAHAHVPHGQRRHDLVARGGQEARDAGWARRSAASSASGTTRRTRSSAASTSAATCPSRSSTAACTTASAGRCARASCQLPSSPMAGRARDGGGRGEPTAHTCARSTHTHTALRQTPTARRRRRRGRRACRAPRTRLALAYHHRCRGRVLLFDGLRARAAPSPALYSTTDIEKLDYHHYLPIFF